MVEADGIIFTTPVYGFQVSCLMKLFIDRHGYIFHRPRFFRQKALLLATAGFAGTGDVPRWLNLVARLWGCEVVARAGIRSHATLGPLPPYVENDNEKKLEKAATDFLAPLEREARARPQLFDVIGFHIGKTPPNEPGEQAPADHRYWTEKGWLEKGRRFYVDVPVTPISYAIGLVAEWYMRRRILRDMQAIR